MGGAGVRIPEIWGRVSTTITDQSEPLAFEGGKKDSSHRSLIDFEAVVRNFAHANSGKSGEPF
jgi:hypothetical protein